MAYHTQEQKLFIVRNLARLVSAPEIIAAFVRLWPTTACAIEDIRAVNPQRGCVDPLVCAVYKAVQADFFAEPPPISKRDVRGWHWQLLLQDGVDRGAPALIMEALRGAAAEYGGDGADGARRITEIVETIVDPLRSAAA